RHGRLPLVRDPHRLYEARPPRLFREVQPESGQLLERPRHARRHGIVYVEGVVLVPADAGPSRVVRAGLGEDLAELDLRGRQEGPVRVDEEEARGRRPLVDAPDQARRTVAPGPVQERPEDGLVHRDLALEPSRRRRHVFSLNGTAMRLMRFRVDAAGSQGQIGSMEKDPLAASESSELMRAGRDGQGQAAVDSGDRA
ncbi:hypothetical protein THAOC_08302, partial [Thalassiosira oceanica]